MSRVCNLVLLNYQMPYRLLKNVYKRYRSSSKMRISLYLFCSLCSFWYPYNINHFPSSKDASYISRTTRAVLMYLWLKVHLFGRLFSLAAQIRERKQRLCRIFIKVCFFHGSAIWTVNIYQRGAQFVHRDMNDLFNVELNYAATPTVVFPRFFSAAISCRRVNRALAVYCIHICIDQLHTYLIPRVWMTNALNGTINSTCKMFIWFSRDYITVF